VPMASLPPLGAVAALAGGVVAVAALIGVVESVMARLRLPRVPQFIIAAGVLAGTALAVLLTGNP
ncbi:MAG: hydrogenase, partial [Candidatus Binatia bacterium]